MTDSPATDTLLQGEVREGAVLNVSEYYPL